jgi:outer membrane receptor protein involved in Fe transport
MVGVMMRIGSAAISVAFAGALLLPAAGASAQTAPPATQMAQASQPADAQPPVRRTPRRVPIYPRYQPEPDGVYPRYYPGPNAVRECTATYVQEFRPSGTVIVPRMSCVWRRG